jgi:hypothetical protein
VGVRPQQVGARDVGPVWTRTEEGIGELLAEIDGGLIANRRGAQVFGRGVVELAVDGDAGAAVADVAGFGECYES